MRDHFVLVADQLLTESIIEADIDMVRNFSSARKELDIESSPRKLADCRICHDEDEDSNMEVPCSCSGSLKYAHRGCVQKWCNEKGDTTCEICLQQFKPDYTAPTLPPLFHYGAIPMDFRGSWEISRRDLHNSQLIAMVSRDHSSSDTDFDEYAQSTSRGLICCRLVAIIFMLLLVLRHTLPFIVRGSGEYSLTLFTLLMLRTIGILLPIFVMFRAFAAVQRRRHLQDIRDFLPATSDEESELPHLQQQPSPHLIQVL
ncbi:hypothetical protein DCAR_0729735 [Daucus carota subsp. sativus]|uniref:RING-CH-type domain-containing protein n=2 Tax=Daucus carota subsp. sativus TaxID=79200 RepID=A0AAF1BA12_DAUCS|nr:hypothetical protein DCAR_0729735 [Daucus carota subsp. sativus]